ncbi:FG-GAP-like repeat-containing protein [Neorhodopirellula pilleata]|nr:FG-GAP-like repeat-containing protein [Neorhodopirellula pilleata]
MLIVGITTCLLGLTLSSGCDSNSAGPADTPPRNSNRIEQPAHEHLVRAQQAITSGDLQRGQQLVQQHLLMRPNDAKAWELAGDLATHEGDLEQASEFYATAIQNTQRPTLMVLDKLAKTHLARGAAFETLSVWQQTLEDYPEAIQPRFDLVGLATAVGLNRMAIEPLRWLVKQRLGDVESLVMLTNPMRSEPDPETCRKLLARYPSDLRPHYGLARMDAEAFRWEAVVSRLQPVIAKHPDFLPASVLYGRALLALSLHRPTSNEPWTSELAKWASTLSNEMQSNPEFWKLVGQYHHSTNDHNLASRAFAKAVVLEQAVDTSSLTELVSSLTASGDQRRADVVAKHLDQLAQLQDATTTFLERHSRSQRSAMLIAYQLVELGRHWEAEAWTRLAKSLPDDPVVEIDRAHQAILARLGRTNAWQDEQWLASLDLPELDITEIDWSVQQHETVVEHTPDGGRPLRLVDRAIELGLQHQVALPPDAETEGFWIHHSVGGGVGVVDYDLDGWPDLALANLDGQARQSNSSPNQLFRNLSGRFLDVTAHTRYHDTEFAQGICVGDFNSDGFADVLDCNIGRNRLYRNNGDGTFGDVTDQVGLQGDEWTTSAVIADIDADGLADIFEVNYCAGTRPMTQPCRSETTGLYSSCPPLHFDAAADRVWSLTPDGQFVDRRKQWLGPSDPGRGLGVIAGELDERPGLDLYVANDMSINHLWSAQKQPTGFGLAEVATVRGLAMSGQSRSQASMGMAVGDPDADGDFDLFLTHFAEEHNTYYEQVSAGIWQDRTFAVGLLEPSLKMLGFGTQFVDLNNNGKLELIITNGHVSDTGRTDIQYRMRPQLFELEAGGHWRQVSAEQIGPYFEDVHLGRALATLDANRDGLSDVVITQLFQPVALLINQSPVEAESVDLLLTATQSHRDAIGTIVQATVGDDTRHHQLTAGDGYMCSNERRIVIATAGREHVDSLQVRWPSGTVQTSGPIKSGRTYRWVEGELAPTQLERHE